MTSKYKYTGLCTKTPEQDWYKVQGCPESDKKVKLQIKLKFLISCEILPSFFLYFCSIYRELAWKYDLLDVLFWANETTKNENHDINAL